MKHNNQCTSNDDDYDEDDVDYNYHLFCQNLPNIEAKSSIRSEPKKSCFSFFASVATIVGAPNALNRKIMKTII